MALQPASSSALPLPVNVIVSVVFAVVVVVVADVTVSIPSRPSPTRLTNNGYLALYMRQICAYGIHTSTLVFLSATGNGHLAFTWL